MLDTLVSLLVAHGKDILAIAGAVVGVASLIVKLTPSQKDDAFVAKVIKFLDNFSVVAPKDVK